MKVGDTVTMKTIGHEGKVKATCGVDDTCLVYLHDVHTWLNWCSMNLFNVIKES